jgi:ATP-dependent Clp protease ATP-binding subunit ClpA
MNSAILMSVQEHFLIGLAEEGEGLAANLLRRYGLTPQALRQQVSKVVGKGRRGWPRLRRRPTRQNSTSTRAT